MQLAWTGDGVDLLVLTLLDDTVHEVAKRQPAPAFVVPTDDLAGADPQRGKQSRGAVALVVMRLANHHSPVWPLQISLSKL